LLIPSLEEAYDTRIVTEVNVYIEVHDTSKEEHEEG
jgi:hypothetical protein